ncbi:MAG: hypothetical protein NXI22_23535, partial [bacterium]|nr:hypothetical protein [bacterium]
MARWRWLFLFTGVALLTGCGESGPVRYQVSGKVQFQGKPVPAGSVIFTPDTAQGNSGPQGVAEIVDGAYRTSGGGLGTVGGP